VDRYSIELENGRSLTLAADQLRRVARGLGEPEQLGSGPEAEPLIVAAIRALPSAERAEAWAVAQLRFGDKLDIESIAHTRGLTPWRVWQLEEAFRQALVTANRARPVGLNSLLSGLPARP
jgi:hypothetical protein